VTTPSALLDLIFLPWPGHEHIFVTATSTGTLSFYTLRSDPTPTITHIYTHQCIDASVLLTDLEAHPSILGLISYVTSSGLVSMIQFNLELLPKADSKDDGHVPKSALVKHHHSSPCADEGFEAWTLAFAPSLDGDDNVMGLYTGSDDSTLRRLDFAIDSDASESTPSTLEDTADEDVDDDDEDDDAMDDGKDKLGMLKMLDRRSHSAGAVAILPLLPKANSHSSDSGEFVLTGSYDDHIRVLYRAPHASTPQVRNRVLAEENLDGGVWRLKLMADSQAPGSRSWTVLASCMHAGSRVVRVTQTVTRDEEVVGEWTIEVLAKFEEHKSMNYGSDVQPLPSSTTGSDGGQQGDSEKGEGEGTRIRTVISTSFYDRLICLWRIDC